MDTQTAALVIGHSLTVQSHCSTVSRPMVTRAGLDSALIQKDTHDKITIRNVGT